MILDAIAHATGVKHPNPGEVKRGAVDPSGRVAWIEGETARLRVAANGQDLVDRKLNRQDETNWGYEGCSVAYLQWWGDRVVAISIEEHVTALWSISISGESACRDIPPIWVVEGDLVMWVSRDYPGLLAGAALPSLRPRTPLPMRTTSKDLRLMCEGGQIVVSTGKGREWAEIERLALPSASQRSYPDAGGPFLALVERRLFADAEPTPSARMLVEATAAPFCDDLTKPSSWVSPVWLPVYWYRHLVASGQRREATRHLSLLDAVTAPLAEDEPERGWRREWPFHEGAVALATRYVRRQARVQATVCRTGELPRGWWCLLFEPAPGSSVPGSRVDPATLTPALRRAFETLAPTHPPLIPHRF